MSDKTELKDIEDGPNTVHVDKIESQEHIDSNVPNYSPETEAAARAGLRWGITPQDRRDKTAEPGPDHPVHKIPPEKQEKMRKKGINPVLYAEMNQNKHGQGGFWSRVSQTAMGGSWIR